MNDIKKLNELWTTARDFDVEIYSDEDSWDEYTLTACTVEENGAARAATERELNYFNDEFSGEISDYGSEYWYEKCC
tara:strand:- start:53 stop:283 length:231 start_codon:yes stop_codon:yes gene_type:complete